MKLTKGAITILSDRVHTSDENYEITIRLDDRQSSTTFCEVKLSANEFAMALSRRGCTPCSIEVFNLDKIGKTHECKKLEFQLKDGFSPFRSKEIVREEATITSVLYTPPGWLADNYYDSQESFFKKDDKWWARTIIRRWVWTQ